MACQWPADPRESHCTPAPAALIIVVPGFGELMLQLQSAVGIFALLVIAWGFSENRGAASLRQAAIGLAVTFATAVILIKLPIVAHAFGTINDAVGAISAASRAGTSFVFGYIGGGALPFDLKAPGADFVLAFQALPIVLVMSVLTTLLFYWRVLPPIVRGMAWLLERTLRGRRRGRAVHRRQHLRRHGGSAAVRAALSRASDARRTVLDHDRRHGWHRRHGAGALCEHAGSVMPDAVGTSLIASDHQRRRRRS